MDTNYSTPLAAILKKAQGLHDPERQEFVDVGGEVSRIRQICDWQRKRIAELEADARRYRWLRDRAYLNSGIAMNGWSFRFLECDPYAVSVDAAIDAATSGRG